MKRYACLVLTMLTVVVSGESARTEQPLSADRLWVHAGHVVQPGVSSASAHATKSVAGRLKAYGRFTANEGLLRASLDRAPRELSNAPPAVVTMPMPGGAYTRVAVVESPIFSPELQARYDEIRTYVARGIDDPTLTGRLDFTSAGFHGMLLSSAGTVFVDPIGDGEYASYWKGDAVGEPFICATHPDEIIPEADALRLEAEAIQPLAVNPSGGQLRTYRLAVSVTGEYTRFFDGNPPTAGTPNTVNQIATTVNRVTGIYERDVQIRLTLVATRIFTDPDTDPFPSGTNDLRGENQTTLDANPGADNYDIGHVFSAGGSGGIAAIGSVCVAGNKARGATSRANPTGDPFDVDYVAHEMGHQFGGHHTWTSSNGSCSSGQFTAGSAYEPGSGSTIMAYAGICSPDDLQSNSDAYFHTHNYDEIVAYRTTGSGNTCGTSSSTGNSTPVIDAGPNCTVPQSTPFTLTATGSDPNGDALTFNWEQFDLGSFGQLPAATNTTGPMFRSRPATSSPSRTFPLLTDILSGAATPWEVLPSVDRTMNFRVTARDNRAGGGGVDYDTMAVTVSGAPFRFTAPAAGNALECGGPTTVQWSVGGGSIAPNVAIQLSSNNGGSFSTLAGNTANDGSEAVTLPQGVRTSQGRMKLVPSAQCFFDISKQFSIVDTLNPVVSAPANVVAECTSPAGTAVNLGTATASDQCDGSLTPTNNAPALFPLGTTVVQWTATDASSHQGSALQSVTVQDTTPPVISCNAPATILPSDAPLTFTASATDACDATPPAEITSFACVGSNNPNKPINKNESCVVQFSGSSITILNSGGIGNTVQWQVRSTDASGNTAVQSCSVSVVKK